MRGPRHTFAVVRRAYTLVELVIVLAILAVLWGIAAPRFANSIARYRAEAAARRLAADLTLARAQAKQNSTSVVVTFDPAGNAYTMNGVLSLDRTSNTYSVSLASEPYVASFASMPFTSNQVTFNAYGSADQSGQIVIQAGTATRTVSLEATSGKAWVQ